MEENKGGGPKKEVQLKIQMDEKTGEGVYSNLALINHNDMEFTLDFLYVQPQAPKATVRARVITNPVHMKRFMMALQENIRRFEQRHGEIPVAQAPTLPSGQYN
jgi:hypothetical protein